jgi:hypothetical protein
MLAQAPSVAQPARLIGKTIEHRVPAGAAGLRWMIQEIADKHPYLAPLVNMIEP